MLRELACFLMLFSLLSLVVELNEMFWIFGAGAIVLFAIHKWVFEKRVLRSRQSLSHAIGATRGSAITV